MRILPAASCAALTVLLLLSAPARAKGRNPATDPPSPCDLQAADIPGKLFRKAAEDDRMNGEPGLVAQVSRRLDLVLAVLKETWPGQRGFEAEYARVMPKKSAPALEQYQLFATLLTYTCLDSGEIRRPDLSDLSVKAMTIRVDVNRAKGFFAHEALLMIDGKERGVLETFDYVGDWQGFPIYGVDRLGGRKLTYVGRPDEKPFLPISQKQYVEAILERYRSELAGHVADGDKERRRGSPPKISREELEWGIGDMEKYLQETPASVLGEQARSNGPVGEWANAVSGSHRTRLEPRRERKGARELFVVNHDYFRRNVPNHIPQLFVLEWAQPSVGQGSRILEQRFMASFPPVRLQPLLDK